MTQRRILCLGAGTYTEQVAHLACQNGAQVVVWDPDAARLEALRALLPITTRCTSLRKQGMLAEALREAPTLLAALTDSDDTNLVTCQLAGQLGFNRSLAVLSDLSYRPFTQAFGATYSIFPTPLLLSALSPTIFLPGTLPHASFALGAIQMRTFRIPLDWEKASVPLAKLQIPSGVCIGCIRRLRDGLNPTKESSYTMLIPQGPQELLPGDEVVCFGQPNAMRKLPLFLGLEPQKVKKVVISGSGILTLELIHFLIVQEIPVQYVSEDKTYCAQVAEQYPECLVTAKSVEQWSSDHQEKMQHDTLFIACDPLFINNLGAALFAKACNCQAVVTGITSLQEKKQVEDLDMIALASTQDLVAERVLSILLSDPPIRYLSLYGGAVVLMEIVVSDRSDAVGLPLAAFFSSILKSALILAVEHRGAVYSPTGETILFPEDRILLITLAKERDEMLGLFL